MTELSILVVDDDDAVRESLAEYLDDLGYAVTTVDSGERALQAISQNTFDVAIVDLRLPGMSGENLAKRIHQETPVTRFIIHTGSMDYRLTKEMESIGVSSGQILLKPQFDMSVFHQTILALTGETGR